MEEPQIGREYRLIRREGTSLRFARFLRYEDGSGMVEADGWHITFELDRTTWRRRWEALRDRGYVELDEALRQGLVTPEEVPR
jgi:hypothetical protein